MNNYDGIKKFLKDRDFSMSNLNSFYMDKKIWILNYLYDVSQEQNEAMLRGVLIEYYVLERLLNLIPVMTFKEWVQSWNMLELTTDQKQGKQSLLNKINNLIDSSKLDKFFKNAELIIGLLIINYGKLVNYQGVSVSEYKLTDKFDNNIKKEYVNCQLGDLKVIGILDFEFKNIIIELKTSNTLTELSVQHLRQISFYHHATNKDVHILKITPTLIKKNIDKLEDFKGYYNISSSSLKKQWKDTIVSIEAMNYYLNKFENNADLISAEDHTLRGIYGSSYSKAITDKWYSLKEL